MTEKRYRAEIYIDIWTEDTGDKEADKLKATEIAEEFASLRPNTFVGDVVLWNELMNGLMGVKR